MRSSFGLLALLAASSIGLPGAWAQVPASAAATPGSSAPQNGARAPAGAPSAATPSAGAPSAGAPSAATPSAGAPAIERARAEYFRGYQLFQQGQYREAASAFEASQSLAPGASTLLFLGECYEHLGMLLQAHTFYQRALAGAKNYIDENALTERAQQDLARVEALLASVVLGPTGTDALAQLHSGPGGDPSRPPIALHPEQTVWLLPGVYTLQASSPGKQPQQQDLTLGKGQRLNLSFPALADAPLPMTHELLGAQPAARPWPTYLPWALTIGGGALVAGALIPGLGAISKQNQLEDRCPEQRCPAGYEHQSVSDSANTQARVADILWITGALVAGAGVTLFILDAKREAEQAPEVQAACSPAGCGLSMRGRF